MVGTRPNVRKHGIDFTAIHSFTWDASIRWVDDREDYGEVREIAIGFIGVTLYAVTFTERDDDVIWIINIRKATKAECRTDGREI
jgi:uncharacterized DUF497 family protein